MKKYERKYRYQSPKKLGFKKIKLTQKEFMQFSSDNPDILEKREIWIKEDGIKIFYLRNLLGKFFDIIRVLLSQFKFTKKRGRKSLKSIYSIIRQKKTGNFLCYDITPDMEMFIPIHMIIMNSISSRDSKKSEESDELKEPEGSCDPLENSVQERIKEHFVDSNDYGESKKPKKSKGSFDSSGSSEIPNNSESSSSSGSSD